MTWNAPTFAAMAGAAIALSLAGWLGDRRRMRRSNPDAVGWVPWTSVSFWAMATALVCLVLAAQAWMRG